jgi:hypothetical protein
VRFFIRARKRFIIKYNDNRLFKNFETISTDTKSADCIILSLRKFSCQDKKIPLNNENDS